MSDREKVIIWPKETVFIRHYSRPKVFADLWLHCEKCGGRIDDHIRDYKFCPYCGRKVLKIEWE